MEGKQLEMKGGQETDIVESVYAHAVPLLHAGSLETGDQTANGVKGLACAYCSGWICGIDVYLAVANQHACCPACGRRWCAYRHVPVVGHMVENPR